MSPIKAQLHLKALQHGKPQVKCKNLTDKPAINLVAPKCRVTALYRVAKRYKALQMTQ